MRASGERLLRPIQVQRLLGIAASTLWNYVHQGLITPAQRRWRNLLVAAMATQGFVNYSKEWWHFSQSGAGRQAYDFPITRAR